MRRDPARGELSAKKNSHSAFTNVGDCRLQSLTFVRLERGSYFYRVTKISSLFTNHEIESGTEAARGVHGRKWFLEDKVHAHLECLLRGSGPVQNGECDGIPVAGSVTQALEHP